MRLSLNRHKRRPPKRPQLTVVTPPVLNVNIKEVRDYLREQSCSESQIFTLAQGANQVLKAKLNTSVAVETLRVYWQDVQDVAVLPYGPHSDIKAERQDEDGAFKDFDDYKLFGDTFKDIKIRNTSTTLSYDGNNRVRVTFKSGYENAYERFRVPILKIMADLYYNRGTFVDYNAYKLPDGVEALISEYRR